MLIASTILEDREFPAVVIGWEPLKGPESSIYFLYLYFSLRSTYDIYVVLCIKNSHN